MTTNKVSKHGGQWQVLDWDGEEWHQVGPYFDTESEADQFIRDYEAKRPFVDNKSGHWDKWTGPQEYRR